jgi:outer membrane protein assembly factor BamB
VTDSIGSNPVVWVVGSDNKLHGLDGDTGTSVFAGEATAMSAVQSIQTPIVANGRIFVASNSQVYAFKP